MSCEPWAVGRGPDWSCAWRACCRSQDSERVSVFLHGQARARVPCTRSHADALRGSPRPRLHPQGAPGGDPRESGLWTQEGSSLRSGLPWCPIPDHMASRTVSFPSPGGSLLALACCPASSESESTLPRAAGRAFVSEGARCSTMQGNRGRESLCSSENVSLKIVRSYVRVLGAKNKSVASPS